MKERIEIDEGLSLAEVEERQKANLVNGEFKIKTKSVKRIISDNVFTLFNLINLILVICVVLVHSYKNTLFFAVVIWNILIGIVQEIKAKQIIDKLSILSVPKVNVLRESEIYKIEMKDIVMDDLVFLVSGNQVCCDCTIVQGECEVNESLITGESRPVFKQEGDELLSGSFIVAGNVKAVVKNLGKDNYVNKITQGAKYVKKPNSEIMLSTKRLIKIVTIFLIPVSLILCYKQLFLVNQDFGRAVVSVVAAVSGMIPSGFILLTSIVLAVSVIRLASHNTLAQDLYCVETLARVDVLCLDKTGTITEGMMQIEEMVLLNEMKEDDVTFALNAYTSAVKDNNPTYHAIKASFHEEFAEEPLGVIPFSSQKKWSLASYKNRGSYILGAPEYVMEDFDMEMVHQYAMDGRRVLLFAWSENFPKERELPEGLQAMALIVIHDKIRENVKETLDYFDEQGVSIKIISGDKPETVSYVAQRAGLKDYDRYVDAGALENGEDDISKYTDYTVFGRVNPYQKLELIKALKENGHTVAMIGDGVNDVLALKEADCSIAMQNGSDAARNTSQLVLMDSDFSSMPLIVAEGRRSINNLQRSGTLYLVKTIYASILAVLFVFLSSPYPFVPIQMTLIGALTIGIPSFVLALERNNNRVKEHFIRNILKLAVPGGVLVVCDILIVMFFAAKFGASLEQIETAATYCTILTSLVILLNLCLPVNISRGILITAIVIGFFIAVIFFGGFFSFVAITSKMIWLIIILAITSFFIYFFIRKMMNRMSG